MPLKLWINLKKSEGGTAMKHIYSAQIKLIDLLYDAVMMAMDALEHARKRALKRWERA